MQKPFASFVVVVLLLASLAAAQSSNEPYSGFFSSVIDAFFLPFKLFVSLFGAQATPSPSPDSQAGFVPPLPSPSGTYPESGYGYPTDVQTLTPAPLLTPFPLETPVATVTVAVGPSPIPTVLPSEIPTVLPNGTPPPIDECQTNADCSCLSPPVGKVCIGGKVWTTTAVCVTSVNPNYCACPTVPSCSYGCQTNAAGVASCCPRSGCAPACDDGTCGASETCSICPSDCGACPANCGNGVCDAGEGVLCLADCPNCGNGVCEAGEGVLCPADCPNCGNGVCEAGEGVLCPADCGPVCGDGFCIATETHTGCPSDCPRPACSLSSDCGPTVRTCLDSSTVHVAGWNCRNPGLASAACTPWSANTYCSLHGRVCVPNGNDSHCGSPPSSFLPSFVRAANEVIVQVSGVITRVLGNLFKLFG